MANEYSFSGFTGSTYKLIRFRNGGSQVWTGSAWANLSSLNDTAFGNAGIAMSEQASASSTGSGLYVANAASLDPSEFGLVFSGTPAPGQHISNPVSPFSMTTGLAWLVQRFRRGNKTPTAIVTKDDAGNVLTTQTITDDGLGTESLGAPS